MRGERREGSKEDAREETRQRDVDVPHEGVRQLKVREPQDIASESTRGVLSGVSAASLLWSSRRKRRDLYLPVCRAQNFQLVVLSLSRHLRR